MINEKYIEKAIEVANNSTDFNDKVGAIILDERKRIISTGYNKKKTHPLQKKYGGNDRRLYLHAEISALVKARGRGKIIIVARITKGGNIGMAMPCSNICLPAIKESGIKHIYFTTNSGVVAYVKL